MITVSQGRKLLILIALVAVVSGYKEDPNEYEAESVGHIDYEKDQLGIKLKSDGTNKVKRGVSANIYEGESVMHIFNEHNQTPAEDRQWQVKPKPKAKRMSKGGKKVHIYLKNEESKAPKSKKPSSSTTTLASTTVNELSVDDKRDVETQTRRAPEVTTRKSDDSRNIRYADKDNIAASSSQAQAFEPSDSATETSEHHDHVIKEKIKIKHHHHHHHHNHVKTVVKKEPYPVEKVIHVPVEKIVEKKVPYKVEVPVEKIVEKVS